MNTNWLTVNIKKLDEAARKAAQIRQDQLTKPRGALGELETIAIRLAAMQSVEKPNLKAIYIAIFAADHGVADEGVSAFPQVVTAEMIKNFSHGGAAICVLAKQLNASLEIIDLGTINEDLKVPGVLHLRLGRGTANFVNEPAMSHEQYTKALTAGKESVERALAEKSELYIGGEMGIANTTAAAALACAFLNRMPQDLAGAGTGLDTQGVSRKAQVITKGLERHRAYVGDAHEVLRRLGGFEIVALAGAFIRCAQQGLPVLIDGFIATVAALAAERIHPGCKDWFFYAHTSAEKGHACVLAELGATPLLNIGMRLGEGSGAAVATLLMQAACALHSDMAIFAEADVSEEIKSIN